MKSSRLIYLTLIGLLLFSLLLASCSPTPAAVSQPTNPPAPNEAPKPTVAPTEAPKPTEAPTKAPEAPPAEPATAPLKVALVLPGLINDGGFNQIGYESLIAAKEKLGIDATYVENIPNADVPKFLSDYAKAGYDVVMGYSGGYANAVQQVAPEFPDTTFVAIAPSTVEFADNVWVIGHDYMDGFFLSGVLAGMTTKTNKLGYVGGAELKSYVASSKSFEQGAKWANPNVEVLITFVGDFNDPVGAKNAALAQIESGVDIIQGSVDNGVFGLFEAAKEKNIHIVHYIKDLCPDYPDVMLAAIYFAYPDYIEHIFKHVADGEKGGYVSNSVINGYNQLKYCQSSIPAEVKAKVEEAIPKLRSGELDYTHVNELQ
jgi:basic membrane protein A